MTHVEVFRSNHLADCEQRGLILYAVGVESQIVNVDGLFSLLIEEQHVAKAIAHLREYEREVRMEEPEPPPIYVHRGASIGSIGYALVLLGTAYWAGERTGAVDWFARGALRGTLFATGEWWRIVTSMTLHTDVAHFIGNLLIGTLFGVFASQALGPGVAWFSIVVAGAFGGLLDALVMPNNQQTIGASGAVFATLGLVAAHAWQHRTHPRLKWAHRWAPLIASVFLLALTGTGGENTDVVAHVTGFGAGVGLGLLYGRIAPERLDRTGLQWTAGATAVAIVAVAWVYALR